MRALNRVRLSLGVSALCLFVACEYERDSLPSGGGDATVFYYKVTDAERMQAVDAGSTPDGDAPAGQTVRIDTCEEAYEVCGYWCLPLMHSGAGEVGHALIRFYFPGELLPGNACNAIDNRPNNRPPDGLKIIWDSQGDTPAFGACPENCDGCVRCSVGSSEESTVVDATCKDGSWECPFPETCDGVDDDYDGEVDEDFRDDFVGPVDVKPPGGGWSSDVLEAATGDPNTPKSRCVRGEPRVGDDGLVPASCILWRCAACDDDDRPFSDRAGGHPVGERSCLVPYGAPVEDCDAYRREDCQACDAIIEHEGFGHRLSEQLRPSQSAPAGCEGAMCGALPVQHQGEFLARKIQFSRSGDPPGHDVRVRVCGEGGCLGVVANGSMCDEAGAEEAEEACYASACGDCLGADGLGSAWSCQDVDLSAWDNVAIYDYEQLGSRVTSFRMEMMPSPDGMGMMPHPGCQWFNGEGCDWGTGDAPNDPSCAGVLSLPGLQGMAVSYQVCGAGLTNDPEDERWWVFPLSGVAEGAEGLGGYIGIELVASIEGCDDGLVAALLPKGNTFKTEPSGCTTVRGSYYRCVPLMGPNVTISPRATAAGPGEELYLLVGVKNSCESYRLTVTFRRA